MTIKIDDQVLTELGLGNLPAHERVLLLNCIYEALEYRVGSKLAERFSDDDLENFERLRETAGDLMAFLKERAPDYEDIVQATWVNLRSEIERSAQRLLRVIDDEPWPMR